MESTNTNDDNGIPSMSLLDVVEQIQVMRHQEEMWYKCCDYVSEAMADQRACHGGDGGAINVESRTKLCNWCFEMVDFCKVYHRETVEIAMSFLDRFLSMHDRRFALQHDQRQLQLAAMTTLYLAIKLFEPIQMDVNLLAKVSHGEYRVTEFLRMEQAILSALQWRMYGPTRMTFARHFLALLPEDVRRNRIAMDAVLEVTRIQMDLATCDYFFTTRRLSSSAMAVVLNALEAIGVQDVSLQTFLQSLRLFGGGVDPLSNEVQEARMRLLSQAGGSPPSDVRDMEFMSVDSTVASMEAVPKKVTSMDANYSESSSPICVARAGATEHYPF